LDRLRRHWIVAVPVLISLVLVVEGILESFLQLDWAHHQLLHIPIMAIIALAAYRYWGVIFKMVQRNAEALRQTNDALEARVRERTAALSAASEALMAEVQERRRSEESLRTLSSAVQHTADAVCITDRNGVIEYINPAFERLSGFTLEEARGRTPRILHSGQQDRAFYEQLWATILSGSVFRGVVVNRRKDGVLWYSELTIAAIRDSRGQRTKFVSTHRDITERMEAEARLRESEQQARAFAARVESIREDERSRIAREIHDELGQALTGLRYDITWLAGKALAAQPAFAERIIDMLQVLDDAVQSVRRISTELRPGLLDDLGLAAAIEWQAQEFQSRTGIGCHSRVEGDEPALEPRLATALFRIVQEALTNVARHAGASRVDVSLAEDATRVTLVVQDDGRGISEEELRNARSLGLLGMRERVAPFCGTVDIAGRPGMGTTVRVTVPLPAASHRGAGEERDARRDVRTAVAAGRSSVASAAPE
jgi:PAS domain S-box-containing protein